MNSGGQSSMTRDGTIRAIIDTNIVIKAIISKRQHTAAKKIMAALDEKKYIAVTSDELINELLVVLKTMVP